MKIAFNCSLHLNILPFLQVQRFLMILIGEGRNITLKCSLLEYQQIKLLFFVNYTWPKLSRLHFSVLAVEIESFSLANGLTLRLVALSLGDLRSGAYTVTYCLSFFHVTLTLFTLTYSSNALTHSPVTVCIDPTCTLCIFCAFHSLMLLSHVEADSI